MKLKIKETSVKEIIVKSNLPKAPFVANPYTGCHFGCVYCYADFMRKWSGHEEEWGEFVDVKSNAAELLDGKSHSGKDILFSSVTDAYQPIESRYKLTRRLLEKLLADTPQPKVSILTKSTLVSRDIDILTRFKKCTVGFSFSTLDDNIRRILEPVTPPIKKRIDAVKSVYEAGIETYIFVSPIMPYLTDIRSIYETFKPYANYFMFENLNVRPNLWKRIKPALVKIDPSLVPKYEKIYFTENGIVEFWEPIRQEIYKICEEGGFKPRLFFHHS